jgi:hypothetical protein
MNLLICLGLAFVVSPEGADLHTPDGKEWVRLFNGKDLDGFYTFLQKHGKNRDPDRVITIEDGMIRLYKHANDGDEVVMGYIATEKEYGDYHLRFQYRWGTRKFKPRYALKRDAGLYYHLTGPDAVWPRALQFQIQQTDVGDLIALYGYQLDTTIDPKTRTDKEPTFQEAESGGEARVLGGEGIAYQKHLAGEFEVEGWNTAEIIARGTETTHILNGKVVNRGKNLRLRDPTDPTKSQPISRGRIALEIEAAELDFRNVEIRSLSPEGAGQSGALKAGAKAERLEATDDMVVGGGIGPARLKGQEGELRASAVVVEGPGGNKVCLVACDVLMIERDILDQTARRIAEKTGIPFDNILINATHTHHAPTTATIHGYEREEAFTRQVGDRAVAAAVEANARLTPVVMKYRRGEESSVGRNSRLLLKDGTIFWTGKHDDALRPTGPFDPELPVLAFQKSDGGLEAVLFNHSTHTIGTIKGAVRSPSFYGLTAQELESQRGGVFLFFEGASGSTHNLDLTASEALFRIKAAVLDTLEQAKERPVSRVAGRRKEITLKVRKFDESIEDAAVVAYCTKRQPAPYHEKTISIFREMRKRLAPMQGQDRKTWVQAIVIGDIALVGVPGEFFTYLGQEIKRRSPYRDTFVFELANDYVGYIPDARAYDRGGYQVWTGLHSYLEKGSGEAIVDAAVEVLDQLHSEVSR